ncbi:MAG TPA: hypothetical protein VIY86_08715, partial [Pirellulaceae bacterium]
MTHGSPGIRTSPLSRWLGASRRLLLVVGALTTVAFGGDLETPARYHRVFVPEGDLASKIQGTVPVKVQDFQRLVERITSNVDRDSEPSTAIERAVYRGSWRDGHLTGTVRFDFGRSVTAGRLLRIEPWDLAIDPPR